MMFGCTVPCAVSLHPSALNALKVMDSQPKEGGGLVMRDWVTIISVTGASGGLCADQDSIVLVTVYAR